jgi:hypothetical protein
VYVFKRRGEKKESKNGVIWWIGSVPMSVRSRRKVPNVQRFFPLQFDAFHNFSWIYLVLIWTLRNLFNLIFFVFFCMNNSKLLGFCCTILLNISFLIKKNKLKVQSKLVHKNKNYYIRDLLRGVKCTHELYCVFIFFPLWYNLSYIN